MKKTALLGSGLLFLSCVVSIISVSSISWYTSDSSVVTRCGLIAVASCVVDNCFTLSYGDSLCVAEWCSQARTAGAICLIFFSLSILFSLVFALILALDGLGGNLSESILSKIPTTLRLRLTWATALPFLCAFLGLLFWVILFPYSGVKGVTVGIGMGLCVFSVFLSLGAFIVACIVVRYYHAPDYVRI